MFQEDERKEAWRAGTNTVSSAILDFGQANVISLLRLSPLFVAMLLKIKVKLEPDIIFDSIFPESTIFPSPSAAVNTCGPISDDLLFLVELTILCYISPYRCFDMEHEAPFSQYPLMVSLIRQSQLFKAARKQWRSFTFTCHRVWSHHEGRDRRR